MNAIIFLFAIALAIRVVGSVIRTSSSWWPIRTLGWLVCMPAAWIAVSAAGAWTSVWPAVLVAAIGASIDLRSPYQRSIWIGADIAVVLLSGFLAVPPLALAPLLGVAIGLAGIGFVIDTIVLRLPMPLRLAALAAPVVAFLLIQSVRPSAVHGGERVLRFRLSSVALAVPLVNDRSPQADSTNAATGAVPEEATTVEEHATSLPLVETSGLNQTGTQWEPYLEWSLPNPSFSGNPFDLVASATFVHESGSETRTTEMFYAGGDVWRFRFTGTRTGVWNFTTESDDPDLSGQRGTVTIKPNPNQDRPGFVTNFGNKWGLTGTNEAFVPQFVMYADPDLLHNNPEKIDADIQMFLVEHGFNGFNVQVFCRWFDITQDRCGNINVVDPVPDPRTFEALELLITKTHASGNVVHLWMWGDSERTQNVSRWGLNGVEDQRLQRYIAARLGPLPGWTMGYGFDLQEWVNGDQLAEWHDYMHARMGWPHLLGARAKTPEPLGQFTEVLDYYSYEQHKPDYDTYVETIERRPTKPAFSEDRFRIRDEGRDKDYTLDMTRRGLWHSAMAGGVANIWGYLLEGASHPTGSGPYPNAEQIKTYSRFFDERFTKELERCPDLTDGVCLKHPNDAHFLFYKEDTATVQMNLASMDGPQRAIAVDTKKPYAEIDLGTLNPDNVVWEAPYESDWAIAVGDC